jgi:hypothetical protein
MIAPELRRGGNGETSRWVLLRNNLLVSALIFLFLELWRPCFFLTDDNLDGGLPFFTEMGRNLLAGHSPFYSAYLFGGHYNLLRDPTFFCWHPLYLAASLLTVTRLHFLIIDLVAFVYLMLSTAGFINLGWYLRRELGLTVSDGWMMFYALSFTYSMIALTTGASWLSFLGSQSALPWLTYGIMQRSLWRGVAIVALFNLHQILGGHLEPTISSSIFFSIFAVGLGLARRSWTPLAAWGIGYLLALIILLPLLIPTLSGFLASSRSHGLTVSDMQDNNIPASLFPTSFFFGMALWFIHPPEADFHETYTIAVGSCAAAWCILPALAGKKWSRLDILLLGLIGFIALLIIRPSWISEAMIHLPLVKSMRWPFREFVQFQFFLHLFLLIRKPGFLRRARFLFALVGLALYLLPLLLHQPPTFNQMRDDRRMILSGDDERYWDKVRALLQPDDRIATVIPPEVYLDERFEIPYSLLDTYNYPSLTRVINIWGYSQTVPENKLYVHTFPAYVFGAYTPAQKPALLTERPGIKFITLESLKPLRITLSSPDGSVVDLTPFIPAYVRMK